MHSSSLAQHCFQLVVGDDVGVHMQGVRGWSGLNTQRRMSSGLRIPLLELGLQTVHGGLEISGDALELRRRRGFAYAVGGARRSRHAHTGNDRYNHSKVEL